MGSPAYIQQTDHYSTLTNSSLSIKSTYKQVTQVDSTLTKVLPPLPLQQVLIPFQRLFDMHAIVGVSGKAIPGTQQHTSTLKDAGLRKLNAWIFLCFLSSFSAGYDGSFFTGLLTLAPWFIDFFGLPPRVDPNMVGLLGCSGVLGLIAGPWVGSWLNDRIGRPKTIMISSVIMAIGGGVSAVYLAQNPSGQRALWIVSRIISSFGAGIGLVAAPSLITELAHPRQRAVLVGFFWCFFFVGSVVAAWIAFACNGWMSSWAWRLPSIVQIIPAVIQLPFLFFAPESPRFLAANGREAEAQETLARYHAAGDANHPVVLSQLQDIRDVVTLDAAHKSASVLDLFRGKANRRRLWVIFTLSVSTQWVGNGIITYYLPLILGTVGITSTRQQAIFNGCLQVFNLICAVGWSSQIERFGRRKMFLGSGIGMLISYILVTALSASFSKTSNPATGKAVIAFLFIFYFAYTAALTPLAVAYQAEILPYRLRSKGLAVNVSMIAVALVFNIFVNPIALAAIEWRYYLVFVAVLVCFCINVYLCYPETMGKTPEALETIFDGDSMFVFRREQQRAEYEQEESVGSVSYGEAGRAGSIGGEDKK